MTTQIQKTFTGKQGDIVSGYLDYHADPFQASEQGQTFTRSLSFNKSVLYSYKKAIAVLARNGVYISSERSRAHSQTTDKHIELLFNYLSPLTRNYIQHVDGAKLLTYVNKPIVPPGIPIKELLNEFSKGEHYQGRVQSYEMGSPLPILNGSVNCSDNQIYVGCTLVGQMIKGQLYIIQNLKSSSARAFSIFLQSVWQLRQT